LIITLLAVAGCDFRSAPVYSDSAITINAALDEIFTIALPANKTTGYEWHKDFDNNMLTLAYSEYRTESGLPDLLGRGGRQYFYFRALAPGQTAVNFSYQRLWENNPAEEEVFTVNISGDNGPGTRTYDLQDFTGVEIGGAFEYEVAQAEGYGVTVTAASFAHVKVAKEGHTLTITREGLEWGSQRRPKVVVTMPSLADLTVSGASSGRVVNFQEEKLSVNVSGASQLEFAEIGTGELRAEVTGASRLTGSVALSAPARFEVSGASRVELTGTATDISIKASGASRLSLSSLTAHHGEAEFSGASSGAINLNGRLDANLSGASSLSVLGNPVMGKIETSGASSIHRE
jgi:predicted secreted protein